MGAITSLVKAVQQVKDAARQSARPYECQVHEYFYWTLMANIGALDPALTNKCEDSADEWYVCTSEELRRTDPLAFDLLNNQGFALPAMVPDGSYRAPGD